MPFNAAPFNTREFNRDPAPAEPAPSNAVVHIVLPRGLALQDGRVLDREVDLALVGNLHPWYASVEEVRLEGGVFLSKLGDLAVAAQVWQASKNADALTCNQPPTPQTLTDPDPNDLAYKQWFLFHHARNNWVSIRAAADCLLNVQDLVGARGSKTLANFSVTKMEMNRETGLPKKLTEMNLELKGWKIVIQSGGRLGFGGHPQSGFAAKGKYDPSDAPAGRLWYTTGMGANRKTVAGWGSAGKPVKFGSPTFVNWRVGRNFGNYISVFPKVIWS